MRVIAALATVGFVAACSILPNSHYFAPEVTGVILQAGRPLAHVRVRLTAELTNETQVATTDDTGRFTIGPLTNYQITVKQFGAAYYGYAIHVTVEGHAVRAFSAEGDGDAPRKQQLHCDLPATALIERAQQYCSVDR